MKSVESVIPLLLARQVGLTPASIRRDWSVIMDASRSSLVKGNLIETMNHCQEPSLISLSFTVSK